MKIINIAVFVCLYFNICQAFEKAPTLEEIEAVVKDTPAAESICDQYTDSKANGLCTSYCEAKDCDDTILETEKSCQVIKDKFAELTGGQTMPCEQGRCPCWDVDELPKADQIARITWQTQPGPFVAVVDNIAPFRIFFAQDNMCQTQRFQAKHLTDDQFYFCVRDLALASAAHLMEF